MANFKVTTFINTAYGLPAGWTESYYTSSASSAGVLLGVVAANYVQSRRKLLHKDFALVAIRVNDVDKPQVSRYEFLGPADGGGIFPGSQGDGKAEAPFDGLLISIQTDVDRRRGFILRGLPKDVIDDSYSYVGDDNPQWLARYPAYLAEIFQDAGSGFPAPTTPWLVRRFTASDPQPATAIMAVGGNLGLDVTIGAQTTPPVVAKDFILVKGEQAAAWCNGRWKARAVANGPPCEILTYLKKRPIRGVPSIGGVTVQGLKIDYLPVQNLSLSRGAKRDTGRPFVRLVGKRRVMLG